MEATLASLALVVVVAVILATILRSLGISMALPLIGAGILLSIAPFGPSGLPEPE